VKSRALGALLSVLLAVSPAAAQVRLAVETLSPSVAAPAASVMAVTPSALPGLLPSALPAASAPLSAPAALSPAAAAPEAVRAAAPAAALSAAPALRAASAPSEAPKAAPALRSMSAVPAAESARAFDGSARAAASVSVDEEQDVPEDLPTDTAEAAPQLVDLFLPRETRAGVARGTLDAHVALIKGKGSAWYWGKFRRGAKIAVKSGRTLFVSKVTEARTVRVRDLTRKDFAGLFTAQRMKGKSLAQLRGALVEELKARQSRRPGAPTPVSLESSVRFVRFLSASAARELPENRDDSAYPVAPREKVSVPEALQGLHHYLPKLVMIDMRLFPNGMPYPLIEDMSKLMKSGVYFALLSDKPNAGPGSVEDQLTRRLSPRQRDQISRYKMFILSDDGNSLAGHSGSFARALPSQRFAPRELEIARFSASTLVPSVKVTATTTRFEAVLPKGADAEAFRAGLQERLTAMHVDPTRWSWSVETRDGRPVVAIRPRNLATAIPHLMEQLREFEGLYVDPSDVMTISRDQAVLNEMKGSVQPAAHTDADGEALADTALASLLGPYRENLPGDLAASASKIQSFIFDPNRGAGDFGNVYMMTGHVMHAAFNWTIWRYRDTGVLPSAEETVEVARRIWEHEADATVKNLLTRPGESLAGYYETVEMRLRAMHAIVVDVLKEYPIAVGTELPNMFVFDRYKKGGERERRDILRLIFDFVVARETADGKLEIAIVDFKTGQVPTLQNLEKDTQVQLYDMIVRRMWKRLPLPYGGTGTAREVKGWALRFLYTAGAYQPVLNDWSRIKFDKFLKNVMNRIRKHNAPPAPKADAKTKAKSKTAPKKAPQKRK
jgi:hypothetical protein